MGLVDEEQHWLVEVVGMVCLATGLSVLAHSQFVFAAVAFVLGAVCLTYRRLLGVVRPRASP